MGASVDELRQSLQTAARALKPMCAVCYNHFNESLVWIDDWLASSPEAAIIVLRRVSSPSRSSFPSYSEVVEIYRRGLSDGWYSDCAACQPPR